MKLRRDTPSQKRRVFGELAKTVSIGGLMIYLVPPEIVVLPSQVTVEPPQVHAAEAATPTQNAPSAP